MSKDELWKLRCEISVGSLFLADYENSFFISKNTCCNFFDGYLDYIGELMGENGISDNDFWDNFDKYDNAEYLYEWYYCCEEPFGDECLFDLLDYILEDDDTEFGGTAFANECVRDFLNDCDEETRPHNIDELNKALIECGIKPIDISKL